MIYILFTVVFLNQRVTMNSQEFNTLQACTDARTELGKQLEPYRNSFRDPNAMSWSMTCVPKG